MVTDDDSYGGGLPPQESCQPPNQSAPKHAPTPAAAPLEQGLRHNAAGYGLAAVATAIATLFRWIVDPLVDQSGQYLLYYFSVVFVAVEAGVRAGLLAIALGALTGTWLFYFLGHVGSDWTDEITRLILFLLFGGFTSMVARRLWAARIESSTKALELKASLESLRQTERALRESERRYRIVAEHPYDWEFWLGADGRFIHNSPSCLDVTGYGREAFEADPDLFRRIIHPDDRRVYNAHRGTDPRLCGTPAAEFRIFHRDGRIRWIAHSCKPVYEGGTFLGIRGTNRDITARKEAEEALRESEAQVRLQAAALEAAPNAISLSKTDPEGTIVWVNPAFTTLTGYSAEEAIGHSHHILSSHRQGEAFYRELWETVKRGEVWRGELVNRRKDGTFYHEEMGITPLLDGNGTITHYIAIKQDITARKLVEAALRESEAHYRSLFNSIDEGFCIIEVIFDDREKPIDYRFLEVNPSFEHQTGLMNAQGKTMRSLVPELEEHWFEIYGRIALTGRPVRFQNRAEQLHRWYDVYAWRHGQPEKRQVAILFNDITKRMQAEQERAAAERSAEQARTAAEKASRAKDHFMAVLSHELRTPLTPVLAALSMLEEQQLDEATRDTLELIHRNVEMEARLIDDLLDVTRMVRGKVPLDKRPVELCRVINRAVEVCKPDIEARGLQFGVDLGPAPYWIKADIARLQQVFWNLLKNAVKFTPHGGCVNIRCQPYENNAVIAEVVDSGIGIEPQALSRIFNPFEQAEHAIAQKFGGLGLGLTIAKTLVELHGGTISAHSAGKDKGATFRVHLPMIAPAEIGTVKAPLLPPASMPAVGALRILLVEDHGDTAVMLKRLLERLGHDVQTASDVATALRLVRQDHFSLLISDLGLPDGSGLDLMRQIRSRGSAIKGIALSGYGMEDDIEHSLEAGFSEHLTKPVDLRTLRSAIARMSEMEKAGPTRLLLVEDHEDTAALLKQLLTNIGFEVEWAPTMARALELTKEHSFDVMLSDLTLPDGSGLDLMHELRTRGESLPGVALSGYAEPEHLEESRNAGFSAHVKKPVDVDALAAVLMRVASEATFPAAA